MSGMNNFFDCSIGLFYYEVIAALETLGVPKTSEALKSSKEAIFGDQDVPVNDEDRLDEFTDLDRPDWDEVEEQLEQIEEEFEDEQKAIFESRLIDYTIACGADGKLSKSKG